MSGGKPPDLRELPYHLSCSASSGAGFTFEVQQFVPKELGRSEEVQTFSGCVVVELEEADEVFGGNVGQVGLARQEAPEATDSILDAAFLPGRVGVAEVGLDTVVMEPVVLAELGAVVEGDGLPPGARQGCQEGTHGLSNRGRLFGG